MTWAQLLKTAQMAGKLPLHLPRGNRRVSRKVLNDILKLVFATIADEVLHGRRVVVPDFGVFYRQTRKARRILNPITRQPIQLPASVGIGFHTSKAIKR